MRLLVIDDTLGAPATVKELLLAIELVEHVDVVRSPSKAHQHQGPDVIIIGGHWLNSTRSLRELFPLAYIIGRGPWSSPGPFDFFPWGDELREPSLALDRLIQEFLTSQGSAGSESNCLEWS